MPDEPELVQTRIAWVGADETAILFVNQAMGQVDDNGDIIITFGQATPPIALGTADEVRQQIESLPFVAIRPVARISLARKRAEDLVRMLQATLTNQAQLQDIRGREESK